MVALMPPKKRGKRGPAPLPDAKRRTESIRVMLRGEEKDLLERAAELLGQDVSQFVRSLCLPAARNVIREQGSDQNG